MAEIRWSAESELWLKEIHDYIAQDSPDAAANVIDGIISKVQLLVRFPLTGWMLRQEPEGEIRILLYGHYRIAYIWKSGDDIIDILGVFHGALNIDRYFPEEGG
jgi:plasmid stabilization system protein ParE